VKLPSTDADTPFESTTEAIAVVVDKESKIVTTQPTWYQNDLRTINNSKYRQQQKNVLCSLCNNGQTKLRK